MQGLVVSQIPIAIGTKAKSYVMCFPFQGGTRYSILPLKGGRRDVHSRWICPPLPVPTISGAGVVRYEPEVVRSRCKIKVVILSEVQRSVRIS